MRRLLLLTFVCLAVVLGLWAYWTAGVGRAPELRPTNEAPEPTLATDAPTVRPPASEVPEVAAVRDEVPVNTVEVPPAPPLEPGGLVVEVVDSAGEPVAGVTVELELRVAGMGEDGVGSAVSRAPDGLARIDLSEATEVRE